MNDHEITTMRVGRLNELGKWSACWFANTSLIVVSVVHQSPATIVISFEPVVKISGEPTAGPSMQVSEEEESILEDVYFILLLVFIAVAVGFVVKKIVEVIRSRREEGVVIEFRFQLPLPRLK